MIHGECVITTGPDSTARPHINTPPHARSRSYWKPTLLLASRRAFWKLYSATCVSCDDNSRNDGIQIAFPVCRKITCNCINISRFQGIPFHSFNFLQMFPSNIVFVVWWGKCAATRMQTFAIEVVEVCFIFAIVSVVHDYSQKICARVYIVTKKFCMKLAIILDFIAPRELSWCHRCNRAKTQNCTVHRTCCILFHAVLFMGMQCTSISRRARRERTRAINFWQTQKLFLRITRIDFRATSDPLLSAALWMLCNFASLLNKRGIIHRHGGRQPFSYPPNVK